MSTANKQGPAKSPTVLETPRPLSAKAEAHWLMESSQAPAANIRAAKIQNSLLVSSLPRGRPSPSSVRWAMGTLVNHRALAKGSRAHSSASTVQLPLPNSCKNRVERRITPTLPQQ